MKVQFILFTKYGSHAQDSCRAHKCDKHAGKSSPEPVDHLHGTKYVAFGTTPSCSNKDPRKIRYQVIVYRTIGSGF